MLAQIVTAPKLQTAVLKYEVNPEFCREQGVLLAGSGAVRDIEIGRVLGKITRGAQTVTKTDVGGGKGALTLANPGAAPTAQAGAYKVAIVEPAADAGTFVVYKPDGTLDGVGTVGVAYDGTVKFTLADGGTDFAAGDTAVVTVSYAAGSGKIVAFDADATDGSEEPYGIAIAPAAAQDGVDGAVLMLVRGPAIVYGPELVWPAGISDARKATAIAQLAAKGIVVRNA